MPAEIESSPVAPHSPPDGIQPLPPLGAGDMDAGAYVRSRLERLWGVLGMPPHTRLDMVLFFTSRDRALTFAGSLELWEAAAAAVLSRESQVGCGARAYESSGDVACVHDWRAAGVSAWWAVFYTFA